MNAKTTATKALDTKKILREMRASLPTGETIRIYNDKRQTDRRIKIESQSTVALIHVGACLIRLGVPFFQAGAGIGFSAPL